jgi:ubiquinone/menaquinone biosynthesis C-methylase UbiE
MSHGQYDPQHRPLRSVTEEEAAIEPVHALDGDGDAETHPMLHGGGRAYDTCAAIFFGGRRHRVFSRLAAESGARHGNRVLDVGCGTGYFTRLMAQAVAPGGSAHGVDASAKASAHAQRITRLDNCTFVAGIAEALDAPDGSYDMVVSSLMIHHLPETLRPRATSEMFRVLRPGGSVLVAEFRPPGSRFGRRLVKGLTRHEAMAENRVDLLAPMVRDAGFDQLRSGGIRPWTYFVQARKPTAAA